MAQEVATPRTPPLVRTHSTPLSVVVGDETPFVEQWLDEPTSPHVPSALEEALKRRPSMEMVIARGILTPTTPTVSKLRDGDSAIDRWLNDEDEEEVSPHIPNSLARFMKRRPSREEVQGCGIFKSSVQQAQNLLTRRALEASLEGAIQRRPTVEALIEKRIMNSTAEENL